MNQFKVSYKRHLAKTISYRILSTGIGFTAMWLATGSLKLGAAFGVAELVYKPIQYYLHERIWYRWIKYGLNQTPKKQIKLDSQTKKIKDTESPSIEKPKKGKRLSYSKKTVQ